MRHWEIHALTCPQHLLKLLASMAYKWFLKSKECSTFWIIIVNGARIRSLTLYGTPWIVKYKYDTHSQRHHHLPRAASVQITYLLHFHTRSQALEIQQTPLFCHLCIIIAGSNKLLRFRSSTISSYSISPSTRRQGIQKYRNSSLFNKKDSNYRCKNQVTRFSDSAGGTWSCSLNTSSSHARQGLEGRGWFGRTADCERHPCSDIKYSFAKITATPRSPCQPIFLGFCWVENVN